jgi:hypothetical protein
MALFGKIVKVILLISSFPGAIFGLRYLIILVISLQLRKWIERGGEVSIKAVIVSCTVTINSGS